MRWEYGTISKISKHGELVNIKMEDGDEYVDAPLFDDAARAVQATATGWLVTADASLVGADAPAVARVRALGAAGGPLVCCLHGTAPERHAAIFAKWSTALAAAGFCVLTLEWPGHGRARGGGGDGAARRGRASRRVARAR